MKLINKKRIFDKYLKIDELEVEYKSGNVHNRQVMTKDNAVCALVYDTIIDKYVLVNQWRPANESYITEVVAGTLDVVNENKESAIKREILEEIGYEVDKITEIASCYTSPGCTTEHLTIYYVEVSNKLENGGGVEDEDIEILYLTKDELLNLNSNDMKTMLTILYIKNTL